LVTPRQSKSDLTAADSVTVSAGGSTSTDRTYDIIQRLTRIEAAVTYLEGGSETQRQKLDEIASEIIAAKATFATVKTSASILKWLVGGVLLGVWGLLSALILMWAKHYFGW